jgi:enterochelin esterase family protein
VASASQVPRPHARTGPAALQGFLRAVHAAAAPEEKLKLVEAYCREARSASLPLVHVEPGASRGQVIFLYQGPQQRVTLHSQLPGPQEAHQFTRIAGTDLFYLQRELPADARIDYQFILDDTTWVLDPWNPRTLASAFGTSSYFWMPHYHLPDFAHHPDTAHGTLTEFAWRSAILGNSRTVHVYLPAEYDHSRQDYPAVYVHDGADYLNFTNITDLVDNAVANGRIPPVILVLIPPVEREKEYRANADFARAIVEELVPQMDAAFRTGTAAQARATLGASLGGLCAIHLAASFPETFGHCAGQSSAFFEESPLDLVPLHLGDSRPPKPLRIHLDVGTYEEHYVRNLLAGNRKFAAALRARGYPLQYLEVHEGHSWGSWRARIVPALAWFWKQL